MTKYALPRGTVVDVHAPDPDDWHVSHTLRIVHSSPDRLVAYKRNDLPIHWKKRNPLRIISFNEASWLVDAGYWIPVKFRNMGYLQVAYINEELLWFPGP